MQRHWTKYSMAGIMLLLLISMLVGCTLVRSPEDAVKAWLKAGLNGNLEVFTQLTCESDRDAMMQTGYYLQFLSDLIEHAVDVNMRADLSHLKFKTVLQDDTAAVVEIHGMVLLSTKLLPVNVPVPIMHQRLRVIREEGQWRVCPLH